MELDTRSIPKIKLDSHSDALYISEALRLVAEGAVQDRAKSITDSAALFARAQVLVGRVIDETMIASAASIQINRFDWMPSMPVDQDMEPYDEGLNRRLQELQVELERQTIKVTQQRKSVPLEIKEQFSHAYANAPSTSTAYVRAEEPETADDGANKLAALDTIEKNYKAAVFIMSQLAKEAPANLSALQRACDVVGEMQGLKG